MFAVRIFLYTKRSWFYCLGALGFYNGGICSPTQAREAKGFNVRDAAELAHTGKCSYGVGLSRFPMSAICLPTMVLEVCSKGLEPSSYTRERYFTISISRDCALRG